LRTEGGEVELTDEQRKLIKEAKDMAKGEGVGLERTFLGPTAINLVNKLVKDGFLERATSVNRQGNRTFLATQKGIEALEGGDVKKASINKIRAGDYDITIGEETYLEIEIIERTEEPWIVKGTEIDGSRFSESYQTLAEAKEFVDNENIRERFKVIPKDQTFRHVVERNK